MTRPAAATFASELRGLATGVARPLVQPRIPDGVEREVDDLLRHMSNGDTGARGPLDASPPNGFAGPRLEVRRGDLATTTLASPRSTESEVSAPPSTPRMVADASSPSVPVVPARRGDTSPGLYSTVSGTLPIAPPAPVRASRVPLLLVATAMVGFATLAAIVGVIVRRHQTASAPSASTVTLASRSAETQQKDAMIAPAPEASALPARALAPVPPVDEPSPPVATKAPRRPATVLAPPPPTAKAKPAASTDPSKDGYLREL